jgi:hypothetical protein
LGHVGEVAGSDVGAGKGLDTLRVLDVRACRRRRTTSAVIRNKTEPFSKTLFGALGFRADAHR